MTCRRSGPRERGDAPETRAHTCMTMPRPPRARGCTALSPSCGSIGGPAPASAGMHRACAAGVQHPETGPRERGDAPPAVTICLRASSRPPRARGCTGGPPQPVLSGTPAPASAGMHRPLYRPSRLRHPGPRERGDAPVTVGNSQRCIGRPPRARGCTAGREVVLCHREPAPASAGMHRRGGRTRCRRAPGPRERGDAPPLDPRAAVRRCRPPRARGCTGLPRGVHHPGPPAPASAGMHRRRPP